MPAVQRPDEDTPRGFVLAVSAYLLWGMLPFYLKVLAHVPPLEVLAHRVIWSVPVAGLLLVALGRTRDLVAAIRNPRMLAMAALTAGLVGINWGIYVWSISNDHALDAALGYYINPLFSVALGAALLGERLTRMQWLAIALAAAAVLTLTIAAGRLPWVAVGLTLSWGFYAFFKKSLPIGPNQGFLLEVLILLIPALGYLAWLTSQGQNHFFDSAGNAWLLVGTGAVTAVPLILYANGAKGLRLSTIGILQYIAPTMIFLIAVFAFGEPFGTARAIAFPMIWAALVLYSVSLLHERRKKGEA